ncbi:MAG: FAD-dependent oxidoreductase [Candidatus Bathyarchaeota archaeon]|nr:FAD-dependent oxidoreductase [Candidatus Bathyarchaeum sp.]
MESGTTAVLGAGLTGLTLGYLMNKEGYCLEVLEKEAECGGLIRSLKKDGFTFDYCGSHVIFSKDNIAQNFILDLLGYNKLKRMRNTKVLYNNRYVKYPFENGLANLSQQENFECLYTFFQTTLKKAQNKLQKPRNLQEWCYYTFGKGISEKYLIPYNEKIWKYPPSKTSLKWVDRIPNPPVADIVKSSLGIETEGYTHQLFFYYPKVDGIQALGNSLKQKIDDKITTNFEVTRVTKENEKWIISNGVEEKFYDKIVSTIPVQKFLGALDTPKEIRKAGRDLKYASLITVMLGLNTNTINNLSWLYIPDKNVMPHRVSFPSNYSPDVVPKGKSSVLAEVTCSKCDKIWRMSESRLIEHVIDDLHSLKILDKKSICFTAVKKTEFAYVINDLDYEQNITLIKNYLNALGVDLLGRFSEFAYLNMDACVRRSLDYVENHRKSGLI